MKFSILMSTLLGSIKACKNAALKCDELNFEQYKLLAGDRLTPDCQLHMQNCLDKIKLLEHWQWWIIQFTYMFEKPCIRRFALYTYHDFVPCCLLVTLFLILWLHILFWFISLFLPTFWIAFTCTYFSLIVWMIEYYLTPLKNKKKLKFCSWIIKSSRVLCTKHAVGTLIFFLFLFHLPLKFLSCQ